MEPLISFDMETNGLDLRHSCKPFCAIICSEADGLTIYEWDVDPLTRQPEIPAADLDEIEQTILSAGGIVMQNGKFDVGAIESVRPELAARWPWDRTHDTLFSDHLLASIMPHDLTAQAIRWLGVDIEPLEIALGTAVKEARAVAKKYPKDWAIAKKHLEGLPSADEQVWRNDYWLPRAICREARRLESRYVGDGEESEWWWTYAAADHPWRTVLRDYAKADPEVTLALYKVHKAHLESRGLMEIYEVRRKLLPIVYGMEARGITLSEMRLEELLGQFGEDAAKAERVCENIAESYGYQLMLPKGANNNSLLNFMPVLLDGLGADGQMIEKLQNATLDYGRGGSNEVMFGGGSLEHRGKGLPITSQLNRTAAGRISLNKYSLEAMLAILPERSTPAAFVRNLRDKRKKDTGRSYLEGYKRYWLPAFPGAVDEESGAGWYVLHPSLNPTGTNTLRWSSSQPNEQNISKSEGTNLRYCFGPAPGREWWSMDAQNIELRIPAYEAGEVEMIKLFEHPDDPPYYGSNHLLNFHTVYPDIWDKAAREVGPEQAGKHCKKKYASTWYQWCKNGGFAVQYGAVEREEGTADRAFHRPGSHSLLKARFTAIHGPGGLNEQCIAFAEKHGYVETMPDKTVDPNRGYPVMCTRTDWGRVLPTVPLNYHVQSTAMWWMMKAMIRCQERLNEYNANRKPAAQVFMVMQIHDELVFDFPRSAVDPRTVKDWRTDRFNYLRTNLPLVRELMQLMSQGGDDLGLPTPVSCEFHPDNWAEGISL